MREIRTSGSEGGGVETNRCSLPLSAGNIAGATLVVARFDTAPPSNVMTLSMLQSPSDWLKRSTRFEWLADVTGISHRRSGIRSAYLISVPLILIPNY